jgi:alpha-galactosidase
MSGAATAVDVLGLRIEIQVETVDGHVPLLSSGTEPLDGNPRTRILRVRVESPPRARSSVSRLHLRCVVPAIDMHGLYLGGDPGFELGYLPHAPIVRQSAAHDGVPFLSFMHRDGRNRLAIGLLDQVVETTWDVRLSEEKRSYEISISKPAVNEPVDPGLGDPGGVPWEESVFISGSNEPWITVLQTYARVAREALPLPALPVPTDAFDPIFCSWTAVHHDVSDAWVIETAELAAALGFRTWLTDDGWHHDDGVFGRYDDVGVWEPSAEKFPDLRQHVRAVQRLGLRYLLWVAPFMVGTGSDVADDLRQFLLRGDATAGYDLLCPAHPETDRIVRDLLARLVNEFGLDGLKIDFIDAVSAWQRTPGHDHEGSLGQAMFRILRGSIAPLAEHQPGLMIEFRNRYANLASRTYANLYRASDLPINFFRNRWQTVMLRLLVPDVAVVTDPMLWHPDDSDENVAVHLINGIATVPMVSVDLLHYPESHRRLIGAWIGFYTAHRNTIVHGEFRPIVRGTAIPRIDFVGEEEIIHGLYEDVSVDVSEPTRVRWILNASTSALVRLVDDLDQPGEVRTRDKFGNVVSTERYDPLPRQLRAEVGGSVEIRHEDPDLP